MKIAIVDVAAETSGALSVLKDFHEYIYKYDNNNEWVIYTSVVELSEKNNIKVNKAPWIKKSWLHRNIWELFFRLKINWSKEFDVVFSLQNMAFKCRNCSSIAYFHNMLLIQDKYKFSFFKKEEKLLYIYDKLISKITLKSLKNADLIIAQTENIGNRLRNRMTNKSIEVYPPQIELDYDPSYNEIIRSPNRFIYPATAQVFKNHEIIVDSVKHLVDVEKINNFEVFFTMKGNENEYAKKIFKMSEGISQISFIGYLPRKELIKMYYSCSLIQTSIIESYPIPLVEAMSIGAPIVALNFDYINEIISSYNNKYICESENYIEFAKSLLESMNSKREINPVNEVVINKDSIAEIIKRITVSK